MILMLWDAICVCLEPQHGPYNISQAQTNIPQVMLSHRLNHTPTPKIHEVSQVQDPYDNPQHSKVLKHFAPLHMMWMLWDAICVCLELQQGQYNITQPQAYLKLLGMELSNLQKIITV